MANRLAALRDRMASQDLDAYLIPSADEHLNEYLPLARRRREWMSGFSGSAGDLLVGRQEAWLFVDSRYHEQAALEVDTGSIAISRLGLEGEPMLADILIRWAEQHPRPPFRLGVDPFVTAYDQYQALQKRLERREAEIRPVVGNLLDQVRDTLASETPMPPFADSQLYSLPTSLTGRSTAEKLSDVRARMLEAGAQLLPITKLDQVAWLFNLRGADVPYNPVFIAYGLVGLEQAWLFTQPDRVLTEVRATLPPDVSLMPYEAYGETLKTSLAEHPDWRVLLDTRHHTLGTVQLLESAGATVLQADHPVERLKCVKNPTELERMGRANLHASRAKTRLLCWLDGQLKRQQRLSEADVARQMEAYYAEEPDFIGLSFNTIAAVGPNSAIVHYGTPSASQWLTQGQFFLLDSGAQFMGGTTDDTRTVIVGEPDALQRHRYTLVLKAHIACARQIFPKGTTGNLLDGITRAPLWAEGLDYGHGTGHGVGAMLNVHEGPNGIHRRATEPLVPGMINSVEPGFYVGGWGGIRLENLCVVEALPPLEGRAGTWYGFEPLTWIPFDKRLIDVALLESAELAWLESYHDTILQKLGPTLSEDELTWLEDACALNRRQAQL
jgi:Xaa-Pro aminopeptidase